MRNLFWVSLIVFLFSLNAWPMDQWLCTEDSSQIQGSRVLACGVGEGANETIARSAAIRNAQEEFMMICGPGTQCGEHKYNVAPSRSTCSRSEDGWKCYRLIAYEIKEDKKEASGRVRVQHSEHWITADSLRQSMMRNLQP